MARLTKGAREFNRGMVVAASIIMSAHGAEVEAEEILCNAGLTTVKALRQNEVDWYDIRILAPVLHHIRYRRRSRPAGRLALSEGKEAGT